MTDATPAADGARHHDTIVVSFDGDLAVVRLVCAACGDRTFTFPWRHIGAVGQTCSQIAEIFGIVSSTVIDGPASGDLGHPAKEPVH